MRTHTHKSWTLGAPSSSKEKPLPPLPLGLNPVKGSAVKKLQSNPRKTTLAKTVTAKVGESNKNTVAKYLRKNQNEASMTHTLPAPPPPNRLGNETLRQTPFYQPGPQSADRRRQATIATGSPPIDTERRKPRNLEPNLGDVPAEIVRSPQSGAKLLSQAFVYSIF